MLAVVMAAQLIDFHFANWQPLQQSTFGVDLISHWRGLLKPDPRIKKESTHEDPFTETESQKDPNDPYTTLIAAAVLPRLRSTLINQWNQPSVYWKLGKADP